MTFEERIETYLGKRAQSDGQFAQMFAKPGKTIEECCRYIFAEVSKMNTERTRCLPVEDNIVYGLAVHYYDEDSITVDEEAAERVSAEADAIGEEADNIELTEEEKQQARQLAIEREASRIIRQTEANKKAARERSAKQAAQEEQFSLFNFDD